MNLTTAVPTKILDARYEEWGLPEQATELSAGYDLRVATEGDVVFKPGEIVKVPLGVAFDLSRLNDNRGQLTAFLHIRSSLGAEGLSLANCTGIVDGDYQGQLFAAIAYRPGDLEAESFTLEAGMRVCQVVFEWVPHTELKFVEEFVSETARGEGGFGSTNK